MIRSRLVFAVGAMALLLTPIGARAQQPLPAEGDEARLLGILKSDAELFEKAKACQRLSIIGASKSVPVLASLLADEELSHYARFGLESNPGFEVDEAFRGALGKLSGQPLIGVINSIGVRRDARAVSALITATRDGDQDVAAAAIAALGAIASPDAIAALKETFNDKETMRVTVADALLTAADLLMAESDNNDAAKIFSALRQADLPKHINVASRLGEIRSGSGDVRQRMTQYLASEDDDLFRIGLELAHQISGAEVTQGLLKQLESLPSKRRTLAIYVLGSRGDRSALPYVLMTAESENVENRVAAISVLGTLGDQSVLPVLLRAAVSENVVVSQAARESLAELQDDRVDTDVTRKLADSDGQERLVLVDAVSRRGISDAIPMLLKFMADADQELSGAAIEALGMTIGAKELPQMVDRLSATDTPESNGPLKDALRKACQRMPDRDTAASVLLDRMAGASLSTKADLLDLMTYVGGPKALAGIATTANGNDDGLADSATQALGK